MSLDTQTQEIRKLRTGSSEANYQAGVMLIQIRKAKVFKEKGYRSFNEYLAKDLSDMDRSWGYVAMTVAEHFTVDHARQYGLKALKCLCNIAREVFKDKKPADLLTGEHRFTDEEGVEQVLDFQKEHGVAALKTYLSTFRDAQDQVKAPKPYTPAVEPLAKALAKAVEGTQVTFHLHEQKKQTAVELYGEPGAIVAVMRKVLEGL